MENGKSSYAFRRSVSQLRTMRSCGQKWLLQYGHGWRPLKNRGTYAFGDTMQAVADGIVTGAITEGATAADTFRRLWKPYETAADRTWTQRGPWKLLNDRGAVLAELMADELPTRIEVPSATPPRLNERLEFQVGSVSMLGLPDYYLRMQQRDAQGIWQPAIVPTVLDAKTSDRDYNPLSAELDDQLTMYQIGEESKGRPVDQLGLMVLIYAAQPRIQWLLVPARTAAEKAAFVADVEATDQSIRAEQFPRNSRACFTMGECQNVPLCYPSQRGRVAVELVQTPREGMVDLAALDAWGMED